MPEPVLIPRPAETAFTEGGAFTFDGETPITFGAGTSERLFAARELQSAVAAATGLRLPIRTSPTPAGIALGVSGSDGTPDGYTLVIDEGAITVDGNSEAGLFYGVQTLKQLVRLYGARIPSLTIKDQPALAHRGVMLDVSRCKVPTRETLFNLVDGLASYKYNQLQLYTEHTFAFASHPDISAGVDPLTPEDMLLLDEYCRQRHVELVPNLQSFGHQRHLLSLPQYSHLDEVGWRWSLTPAREETYALLADLYADFLPNFTSRWLNVDCDETWDLATGQSKALAERIGKGRVYLQHILRLHELASEQGRNIMLWADVLHHYPDLVAELPDVLLLDWEYEAADAYPTAEALGRSGRAFWVCPGTSSWNTLFPRLDNALGNVREYVRNGIEAGTTGMLLTDWGDYGHYSPLSLSWYPYLFGAATAWTGARTSPDDFDAGFAVQFLGKPVDDSSVKAMRRLGRAVTAPGLGRRNGSNLPIGLFEDPLRGHIAHETPRESLEEVRDAANEAIGAWATLADPDLRHDYTFTARLIAFTATKLLHGDEALETDRRLARALREEFEACWMRSARRSEIDFVLGHFDALDGAYAAGAEGRAIEAKPLLWEQGHAELRKLADVAGIDALPDNVRQWLA